MSYYRLYYLNQHGHIRQAVDWECDGDGSALTMAEQRADGRAMELWSGDRRVAEFAARAAQDHGPRADPWPRRHA